MKLSKTTPDGYFRVSIESKELDALTDDDEIPNESLEYLASELELLAFELRSLMLGDDDGVKRAN